LHDIHTILARVLGNCCHRGSLVAHRLIAATKCVCTVPVTHKFMNVHVNFLVICVPVVLFCSQHPLYCHSMTVNKPAGPLLSAAWRCNRCEKLST
jgi:hypothetical protein